eukprot:c18489_g1_i1.p1 GENE.c18489_g1_i1~~c18489_g1_i1.p1  ORF type:complete len:1136 (+),score=275.09 c18489_g1_i1:33-3410(+)
MAEVARSSVLSNHGPNGGQLESAGWVPSNGPSSELLEWPITESEMKQLAYEQLLLCIRCASSVPQAERLVLRYVKQYFGYLDGEHQLIKSHTETLLDHPDSFKEARFPEHRFHLIVFRRPEHFAHFEYFREWVLRQFKLVLAVTTLSLKSKSSHVITTQGGEWTMQEVLFLLGSLFKDTFFRCVQPCRNIKDFDSKRFDQAIRSINQVLQLLRYSVDPSDSEHPRDQTGSTFAPFPMPLSIELYVHVLESCYERVDEDRTREVPLSSELEEMLHQVLCEPLAISPALHNMAMLRAAFQAHRSSQVKNKWLAQDICDRIKRVQECTNHTPVERDYFENLARDMLEFFHDRFQRIHVHYGVDPMLMCEEMRAWTELQKFIEPNIRPQPPSYKEQPNDWSFSPEELNYVSEIAAKSANVDDNLEVLCDRINKLAHPRGEKFLEWLEKHYSWSTTLNKHELDWDAMAKGLDAISVDERTSLNLEYSGRYIRACLIRDAELRYRSAKQAFAQPGSSPNTEKSPLTEADDLPTGGISLLHIGRFASLVFDEMTLNKSVIDAASSVLPDPSIAIAPLYVFAKLFHKDLRAVLSTEYNPIELAYGMEALPKRKTLEGIRNLSGVSNSKLTTLLSDANERQLFRSVIAGWLQAQVLVLAELGKRLENFAVEQSKLDSKLNWESEMHHFFSSVHQNVFGKFFKMDFEKHSEDLENICRFTLPAITNYTKKIRTVTPDRWDAFALRWDEWEHAKSKLFNMAPPPKPQMEFIQDAKILGYLGLVFSLTYAIDQTSLLRLSFAEYGTRERGRGARRQSADADSWTSWFDNAVTPLEFAISDVLACLASKTILPELLREPQPGLPLFQAIYSRVTKTKHNICSILKLVNGLLCRICANFTMAQQALRNKTVRAVCECLVDALVQIFVKLPKRTFHPASYNAATLKNLRILVNQVGIAPGTAVAPPPPALIQNQPDDVKKIAAELHALAIDLQNFENFMIAPNSQGKAGGLDPAEAREIVLPLRELFTDLMYQETRTLIDLYCSDVTHHDRAQGRVGVLRAGEKLTVVTTHNVHAIFSYNEDKDSLAKVFRAEPDKLMEEFRKAPVSGDTLNKKNIAVWLHRKHNNYKLMSELRAMQTGQ